MHQRLEAVLVYAALTGLSAFCWWLLFVTVSEVTP
jgi:hypothetical protein